MKSTSGTMGIVVIAAGVLAVVLGLAWLGVGLIDNESDLGMGGALLGVILCVGVLGVPLIGGGYIILSRARREQVAMAHVARQRKLLGTIEAAGEITIAELALETDGTRDTVRQDLYDLVSKGLFSGYVDWDRGRLVARQASELRGNSNCPNCGAELSLAGKGLIRCSFCGAEVFLP